MGSVLLQRAVLFAWFMAYAIGDSLDSEYFHHYTQCFTANSHVNASWLNILINPATSVSHCQEKNYSYGLKKKITFKYNKTAVEEALMVLNAMKISGEQFFQSSFFLKWHIFQPLLSYLVPLKTKKVTYKISIQDQKKYEMEEGVNKAAWEKTMANNRQK